MEPFSEVFKTVAKFSPNLRLQNSPFFCQESKISVFERVLVCGPKRGGRIEKRVVRPGGKRMERDSLKRRGCFAIQINV